MITGIQIVTLIFSLVMFYITYLHLKRKEIMVKEAVFFFATWSTTFLLTLFPASANFILNTFRIYRLLDLATIGGFMILVGISYNNFIEIRRLKSKIEKIVREKAIKNAKK